jgi:hypothetical protein
MLAGSYDLNIEQGATFTLAMFYQDDNGAAVDLTGRTARMQLRTSIDGEVEIELTTENSRIIIDGPRGQITLSIAATDTEELTGGGVYDLELVQGAIVERILEGFYKVKPEVTR